ncbi:MAG: AI-2E family transporter [Devosia sp.]
MMQPGKDRLASIRLGVGITALLLSAMVLHALRHVLNPMLLAVFLLFTIGGLEKALSRRLRLAPSAALPVAILFVVGLFALSVWIVATNASHLVSESSGYAERLNKLLQIGSDRLGLQAAPTIDGLFRQINPGRYLASVASGVGGSLEATIFTLIYLGFLLASRRSFQNKVDELFHQGESEAAIVFKRIQHGVESYIGVQTVIGFMIAGASALIMWPMGIGHIWFWSFLIFIANYVPAIGGALGVLLPALYGLVELEALWKPLVLVVLLETVHFTVNHVIQPRLQGQSLNIDPLVVLLSLAFWSVMFGMTGAFLSTPLTVIVMALCAEFQSVRWIAVLLSQNGKPYAKV